MLNMFQRYLDSLSQSLMTGDYPAYRAMVDMPLVVLTDKATLIVTEESDFETGFSRYHGKLRTEGATDLIRLGHAVSQYGDNLITGRYETHVLRSGQRLYGPTPSAMTMRRNGDHWKITSLVNPVFVEKWPGGHLHSPRVGKD